MWLTRSDRRGQAVLDRHQAFAYSKPQLIGRHASEGDQQHLAEVGGPFGDHPGGERGDGVGLAGARAGLEHSGTARQLAVDVEGRRIADHRRSSTDSSGWKTRRARVPNRLGSTRLPRTSLAMDG